MVGPNKHIHFELKKDIDLTDFCKKVEHSTGLELQYIKRRDKEFEEISIKNSIVEGVTVVYSKEHKIFIVEPHRTWKGKYLYFKIIFLAKEFCHVDPSWKLPSWVVKKWCNIPSFRKWLIK